MVIVFLLFSLSSHIPQGYFFNGESVQLAFPLKQGTYYVAHGGNSPAINYHNANPTQQYALDIVKLNALGTRANGFYPRSPTNYAIWGEPLYSPCSGTIRETTNDLPDLIPPQSDSQNPTGNHILIQCDTTVYLTIRCFLRHSPIGLVERCPCSTMKLNNPVWSPSAVDG